MLALLFFGDVGGIGRGDICRKDVLSVDPGDLEIEVVSVVAHAADDRQIAHVLGGIGLRAVNGVQLGNTDLGSEDIRAVQQHRELVGIRRLIHSQRIHAVCGCIQIHHLGLSAGIDLRGVVLDGKHGDAYPVVGLGLQPDHDALVFAGSGFTVALRAEDVVLVGHQRDGEPAGLQIGIEHEIHREIGDLERLVVEDRVVQRQDRAVRRRNAGIGGADEVQGLVFRPGHDGVSVHRPVGDGHQFSQPGLDFGELCVHFGERLRGEEREICGRHLIFQRARHADRLSRFGRVQLREDIRCNRLGGGVRLLGEQRVRRGDARGRFGSGREQRFIDQRLQRLRIERALYVRNRIDRVLISGDIEIEQLGGVLRSRGLQSRFVSGEDRIDVVYVITAQPGGGNAVLAFDRLDALCGVRNAVAHDADIL